MTKLEYKIKSVKLDSFDRIHVIFKDGTDYYLYADDIQFAEVISKYVQEKALRFVGN